MSHNFNIESSSSNSGTGRSSSGMVRLFGVNLTRPAPRNLVRRDSFPGGSTGTKIRLFGAEITGTRPVTRNSVRPNLEAEWISFSDQFDGNNSEDNFLRNLVKEHGPGNCCCGRSENCVMNEWTYNLRRASQAESLQSSSNLTSDGITIFGVKLVRPVNNTSQASGRTGLYTDPQLFNQHLPSSYTLRDRASLPESSQSLSNLTSDSITQAIGSTGMYTDAQLFNHHPPTSYTLRNRASLAESSQSSSNWKADGITIFGTKLIRPVKNTRQAIGSTGMYTESSQSSANWKSDGITLFGVKLVRPLKN